MIHGASLTDATLAYPHFTQFPHHGPQLTTRIAAAHNRTSNGGGLCNSTLGGLPLTETGYSSSSSLNGHSNGTVGAASSPSAMATLTAAALAAASTGLPPNVKDSRWLTLEVCRQFQRNQCSRDENECKFAHPPAHVDVQNGRVVCCYDSIKGKCQRRDPACKYLHPPMHLREQLMMNGRTNMMLRNWQMQMAQHQYMAQSGLYPFNQAAAVAAVAAAAAASCSPPPPSQPPSSTCSVPVTNDPSSVMYPGPTPLALTNPFLNISYSPYLGALASSNLSNGPCTPNMSSGSLQFHDGIAADCGSAVTSAMKRAGLTDMKNGLSLFHLHHQRHHHHPGSDAVPISTCTSKINVTDTNGSPTGCVVIMNGTSTGSGVISSHLDSNGTEAGNSSPSTGCQLAILPTTATTVVSGTTTSEQQLAAAQAAAASAAAVARVYSIHSQPNPAPPPQAPNPAAAAAAVVAASMLNVHGVGQTAHQLAAAVPFTATAAMNGTAIGAGNHHAAAAHYSTIAADPTGYFHPAYQFELQPYSYQ